MPDDTNAGKTSDAPNQPVTTTNKPVFDPSKYTDSTGVKSSNKDVGKKNRGG